MSFQKTEKNSVIFLVKTARSEIELLPEAVRFNTLYIYFSEAFS